jgi:hypothetical protein
VPWPIQPARCRFCHDCGWRCRTTRRREPATIKLIEDTHDERTLDGWITLAGTSSFDDFVTAVRTSRAR